MRATPDQKSRAGSSPADRRRSKRVSMAFQIEVSGTDLRGVVFRDPAMTNDVNEHGCQFECLRKLSRGEHVSIRLIEGAERGGNLGEPQLFEVVWVTASTLGWQIGAMKLDGRTIWPMKFPPKR